MADDNLVLVEFGAKIDKLVDATNQVHDRLKNLSDSADSLGSGFGRLGELIVGAFSIEAIVSFIEKMADLGLKTERTMAMLGTTAEQTLELSGMAKLTGTSMEGLTLSFERLYLNVQKSTRDAFNPAAQGLKVLGLNAQAMIATGGDFSKIIDMMHNSVSGFNPSMNLTAAVMAVGGRGIAQIIPLLQSSGMKWKEMREAILAANGGLAENIPKMADTHAYLGLLDLSVQSLSAEIFNVLQPTIVAIIKTMKDFAQEIRDNIKDGGTWYYVIESVAWIVKSVATYFHAAGAAIRFLAIEAKAFWDTTADNQKEVGARLQKELEEWAKSYKKTLEDLLSVPRDVKINAPPRKNAGAIDTSGADQMAATAKGIEASIGLVNQYYQSLAEKYTADVAAFRMTEQQKDAALMESMNNVKAFTNSTYDELAAHYSKDKATHAAYLAAKAKAEATNALAIQKLNSDLYAANQKIMAGYVGTVETSWNSSLRGMLAGTTTFVQAMKTVIADLIIYWIEQIEKKFLFEKATMLLTSAFTNTAKAAEVPVVAAAESAKVTAVVAGQAGQTAATEVGAATRITSVIGEALTVIGAKLAEAFAGLVAAFSWAGPLDVPLALGVIGGAGALAYGMIKGFEVGTDFVPSTGLAMLHKGEKVIPASDNAAPYTGNNGGANVSVSVSAWDGASVQQWLSKGGAQQLAGAIVGYQSRNPSARPAW